jgi:hypothetical protein
MCKTPVNGPDGITFACRECDDCISARINDWADRAMAEKATSKETLVLTLTYRNQEDGTEPEGAKAFNYKHVQDFLKRVRDAYKQKYGKTGEIRYIVAGERGSQRDRVHWHMILFADRPISQLGDIRHPITRKILNAMPFGKKKRFIWRFWKHGHCNAFEPEMSGMRYVLKYCVKDQFNIVKSQGKGRETKAETHGASMFRMSKKPPIGQRYLERQIADWRERGVVPPQAVLRVEGVRGYWWPKKDQRTYLLEELHEINREHKEAHGKDCAGWTSLLASVLSQEKDWETLVYGKQEELEGDGEAFEQRIRETQQIRAKQQQATNIRDQCGSAKVCRKCWNGFTKETRREFREWYHGQAHPTGKVCNPFCTLNANGERGWAFGTARRAS